MTETALFSAGFAWTDDDGVADVATPVATPEPAVRPSENHGVDGKSHTPVASVASVANPFDWGDEGDVSQDDVAEAATLHATPETAEKRHPNRPATPPVADVASVALWREAVAWMRTNPQPPAIYATSWSLLCDDADDFVATWGAEAVALGWSTEDVFGAHPDPAARRLDTQGLVTLLQGRPVQSLERWTALIGSVGQELTHTRYPKPRVCVPVWMVARSFSTNDRGQAVREGGLLPSRFQRQGEYNRTPRDRASGSFGSGGQC